LPNFAAEKQKKGQNMKVITIESSAFTALTEQIAEIAVYVRAVSGERKGESSDMLLTTREAAHLLNVSTRTLQRMRTDHRIEYVVVRGSCRYRLSEILRLLEDNTVRNEEGTIDTLFHNHTLRTGGKPKGRRT
jgi:excisionase family DNA binding protein